MLNAIILAGEQQESRWNDSANKALLRINGKTMIEYVIDAFNEAEEIDKIVVVGSKSELEDNLKGKVDKVIESKGPIMDNVLTGINYLGDENPLIVSTCDIPMITAEALNDFIYKSKAMGADFCYPIVEKGLNDSKYPEFERTYVKIREGTFTGGNIFYINPRIVYKCYQLASKLIMSRKNPFKMAGILGPGFLVQLVTGKLTISKLEKTFSEVMRIKARAVISMYPEIGNDVDKPSDVIVVTAHLSQ